jgi:hypothetical protein
MLPKSLTMWMLSVLACSGVSARPNLFPIQDDFRGAPYTVPQRPNYCMDGAKYRL